MKISGQIALLWTSRIDKGCQRLTRFLMRNDPSMQARLKISEII